MLNFATKTYSQKFDQDSAAIFCDAIFTECVFNNCGLSLTQSVSLMSHIQNVQLIDCNIINCQVGAATFEDVTVDGLSIHDMLVLRAPLFRRVTLRGNIGRLLINKNAGLVDYDPGTQIAFDAKRHAFYADADWALDISQAKFLEVELDGIPARLVRRDPETQVVVSRQRLLARPDWRELLSPSNDFWPFVLEQFLTGGDPDLVLAAPKRAKPKEFKRLVAGLQELRNRGLAEPE